MLQRFLVAVINRIPAGIASRFRRDTFLGRLVRPILNRGLVDSIEPVTVRAGEAQGIQLLINPLREKFYWTGQHDLHVQEAISRTLRPGMTFWDVGAHIGFMTMLGSRLVGAQGKVVAFEPSPAVADRLEGNVQLNDAANTEVIRCAVGERSGPASFNVDPGGFMGSLVDGYSPVTSGRIEVPVRTLDELASENGPPDVIKIDAEDAEIQVLAGGQSLLSQEQRPTLIVEFLDDGQIARGRELLESHYDFQLLQDLDWLLTPRDGQS